MTEMVSSLLISSKCAGEHHLLFTNADIPTKALLSRINVIISTGAKAIVLSENLTLDSFAETVLFKDHEDEDGFYGRQVEIITKSFELDDLERFGRSQVDGIVDRVFVDIAVNSNGDNWAICDALEQSIYSRCCRLRIPINVCNNLKRSTFSLLSTYTKGNLQIGVTTNHQGCKLANRIRREVVKELPQNIDEIVQHVGDLRRALVESDREHQRQLIRAMQRNNAHRRYVNGANAKQHIKPNSRSAWLSQIIDYFPLSKLGAISMEDLSNEYLESISKSEGAVIEPTSNRGEISLVGAGPGSLSMLTLGALNCIYNADIVLSDKLVPQEIIDCIPKTTKLFIARKFPGNACNAQQELHRLALESLKAGKKVVRLKQGDPYIFGRGGEEYEFFVANGFRPVVVPGLSSALVAPAVAQIPTTQRDVSDQVLICTGTAKNGKIPENMPSFDKKRTVVFLMAVKKVTSLVPALLSECSWPSDLPVAIIERASCPDQRVIRTHLSDLPEVVQSIDNRPPGLIVAGYSCDFLAKHLGPNEKYRIEEGYKPFPDSEGASTASIQKILATFKC